MPFSKIIRASALAASLFGVLAADAAPLRPNWSIDPAKTNIGFSIDAVGWPRTVGKFGQFDGKLAVDLDHPAKSQIKFRVQANSVNAGSDGLNEFVRSTALLNADQFPTIDFVSTSVEKTSDRSVRVVGDLTLLGVTRPLTVDVDINKKSDGARARLGFTVNTKIDRLDYGMTSGYPIISRDVFLTISTEALEQ